jgi:hypothetical protein
MSEAAALPSWIRTVRWGVLVAFLAAGLYLLNDAAYSIWLAGGPPGDNKLGWERRGISSLSYAFACFMVGAGVFRALVRLPRVGTASCVLLTAAIALACAPFVWRQLLIDKCLDSGGQWSHAAIECQRP